MVDIEIGQKNFDTLFKIVYESSVRQGLKQASLSKCILKASFIIWVRCTK